MPPSPQLGLESNKPGPSGQSNLDSQTCAGEELYSEDQEHHGQLTVRVHSETEVDLHSSDSDSSSEADELRIFQEFSRTRLDSDDESEPEQHYCSYCREVREVSALKQACKLRRYCFRQCQMSHWSAHKVACKAMQAAQSK